VDKSEHRNQTKCGCLFIGRIKKNETIILLAPFNKNNVFHSTPNKIADMLHYGSMSPFVCQYSQWFEWNNVSPNGLILLNSWSWSMLLIFLVFCVVLLCVFTFWVPWCDVCYDICIQTMFGSSLPPVVCKSVHVLLTWFVFVWSSTYCVVFFLFFSSSCVSYVASFSGLSFFIAPAVFSFICREL
jgi:hypothetical protein